MCYNTRLLPAVRLSIPYRIQIYNSKTQSRIEPKLLWTFPSFQFKRPKVKRTAAQYDSIRPAYISVVQRAMYVAYNYTLYNDFHNIMADVSMTPAAAAAVVQRVEQ